jgi:Uncharacterised nucleotidyltransferase
MVSLVGDANGVHARGPSIAHVRDGDLELWGAVDRLVDGAPNLQALTAHRLHLLAVHRWTAQGRPVPEELLAERRGNAFVALVAGIVLEKIRAACDGPILLVKGPEAAASYPDPSVRPFRDLDLLVPDASAVQSALLAAGFELTGDERLYRGIHHLRPVALPELPLLIEVHERPKWVDGLPTPTVEELIAASVPSTTGVEGIHTLPPEHHALLLAAHGWAHVPLRRLLDLVDVAAAARRASARELRRLARAWGMTKLWRTTDRAIEALFYGGPAPLPLRTWARNLGSARERTVLEFHLQRTFASFWALPPHRALAEMGTATLEHVKPEPGEHWRVKLARSGRALRNPLTSVADHDRAMEAQGLQAPSKEGVSNGGSTPADE